MSSDLKNKLEKISVWLYRIMNITRLSSPEWEEVPLPEIDHQVLDSLQLCTSRIFLWMKLPLFLRPPSWLPWSQHQICPPDQSPQDTFWRPHPRPPRYLAGHITKIQMLKTSTEWHSKTICKYVTCLDATYIPEIRKKQRPPRSTDTKSSTALGLFDTFGTPPL
jgi:hypothetical protein